MVTKSDRQTITGKVHFQKGLEVKELVLKDLVNGVNINFIFKDAVRRSVPQVIQSSKKFANALGLVVRQTLMVEKDLKVLEKVNDVDISELSKITVLKYGEQEIYGRKTLSNIIIRQNMYVGGKLSLSSRQNSS
ncbi:uncharacterized protein LOC111086841 isoform X1 [Limulus polyphemus]|uniref:Uncharacterized protein LOC111086841 isoform X1 n=1 Tax=Limulus polyphemus TaxID=6850 RepID=A0ABM1STV6_LIMPO|nr:uncharacterized protein LOC111086841 isoform X1 [Limulus polyphemus]